MASCPKCGKYIDSSANFCPYCGTQRSRENSSGAEGCALLIALVIMGYAMCKGSIKEFFNDISYHPNVWCGSYSSSSHSVRILEKDVEKGGSSICLTNTSWKKDKKIKLGEDGVSSYDSYEGKIIIFEATINGEKFENVKNIKTWQK